MKLLRTIWGFLPCDCTDSVAKDYAYEKAQFSDPWLDENEQCFVCGDHHEGAVPLVCETGDGV